MCTIQWSFWRQYNIQPIFQLYVNMKKKHIQHLTNNRHYKKDRITQHRINCISTSENKCAMSEIYQISEISTSMKLVCNSAMVSYDFVQNCALHNGRKFELVRTQQAQPAGAEHAHSRLTWTRTSTARTPSRTCTQPARSKHTPAHHAIAA